MLDMRWARPLGWGEGGSEDEQLSSEAPLRMRS